RRRFQPREGTNKIPDDIAQHFPCQSICPLLNTRDGELRHPISRAKLHQSSSCVRIARFLGGWFPWIGFSSFLLCWWSWAESASSRWSAGYGCMAGDAGGRQQRWPYCSRFISNENFASSTAPSSSRTS